MASPGTPSADEDVEARTPRWVVAFGIVAALLVLAFLVLHALGRGLGGHAP